MPGAFPFPKEQKLRSFLQAKIGCAKEGDREGTVWGRQVQSRDSALGRCALGVGLPEQGPLFLPHFPE